MEKLELRHLSGYLPYGLKARIEDYKCNYVGREFDEVIGFHQWDKNGLLWSVLTDGGANPSIEKIKPILRPLSDLTKEIEVNVEKFIPISLLNKTFRPSSNDLVPYGYNGNLEIDIETENYSQTIDLMDGFYIAQKLLEWHFDIYGLIEKGLAIDKNTL